MAAGSLDLGSVSARGSAAVSPRGILKSGRRPSRVSGLQWDEKTIADHDLDRGTRTKIVEPKTPFHRSRGLGDDDAAAAEDMVDDEDTSFEAAASAVVLDAMGKEDESTDTVMGMADAAPADPVRHHEFEVRRKMIYKGEGAVLHRASSRPLSDDDEDDD